MKNINQFTGAAVLLLGLGALASPELPPWLDVSGGINYDTTSRRQNGSTANSYQIQDAELRFEILAREGVKFVIQAELENQLNQLLKGNDHHADIEKMLEEAYIEIQTDKLGLPRALVTAGKQRMAFGQRLTEMPNFKNSLLYRLNNEEEMIGLTVSLPTNFFKIVDTVAISLYEAGAGDLKFSDKKGMSLQMTKQLTQKLAAQVSTLMKEQTDGPRENRTSIGLVYTGENGSFRVWSEGIVTSHNPQYLSSKYAATAGVALKMGVGVVVLEASMIENADRELALSYSLPVGSYLILSPELRRVKRSNGDTETLVGIRARLEFGSSKTKIAGPR